VLALGRRRHRRGRGPSLYLRIWGFFTELRVLDQERIAACPHDGSPPQCRLCLTVVY
jgi:hypothetical protein